MIFLNFEKWSTAAGEFFTWRRIYFRGRWTPIVTFTWRHGWFKRNSRHDGAIKGYRV